MELNELIIALVGDWLCKVCLNTAEKKTLSGELSKKKVW